MRYEIACDCGKINTISEQQLGTQVTCSCGRVVSVDQFSSPTTASLTTATGEGTIPRPMEPGTELATSRGLDQNPTTEDPLPHSEAAEVDQAADFRSLLTKLTPRVIVTPILVAFNVLVFILMVISGVDLISPGVQDLLRWGADFGPKALSGEWWRLITCIFVHIGLLHLVLNMWVLLTAGPLVERMLGNTGFLTMYFVAGLTGSFASLFWNPMLVTAGASGAIFGIYGALLGLLLRHQGSIPTRTLSQLRDSGVSFLFVNLIYGMTQKNIDTAAHLGGLVGGFLCGVVMSQAFTLEARAGRIYRNITAAVIGVVIAMIGAVAISNTHAKIAELEQKVNSGPFEVYYAEGATLAEAERLAKYLSKEWGAVSPGASVQIRKSAVGYQFRMVVRPDIQLDENFKTQLSFTGVRISRDVFSNTPVEVHACDQNLKTLLVVPPRQDFRFGINEGRVEVFYAGENLKEEAEKLAKYLALEFKDAAGPVSFKLAQRGDIFEVHMVTRPEAINDPTTLESLRQWRFQMAENVFKQPNVELHLCNDNFQVLQILKP